MTRGYTPEKAEAHYRSPQGEADRASLHAALELQLNRLAASLEAKRASGRAEPGRAFDPASPMAVLRAGEPAAATDSVADVADLGRAGVGKNPRRGRMGA